MNPPRMFAKPLKQALDERPQALRLFQILDALTAMGGDLGNSDFQILVALIEGMKSIGLEIH